MKKTEVAFILFMFLLLEVLYILRDAYREQLNKKGCGSQEEKVSPKQASKGPAFAPCSETVKIFKQNLKPTVDPCENFYEFACGNFGKYHPLPDYQSSFGSEDLISERVKDILMKSLLANNTENEIKPIKYVRLFFKRMTDEAVLDKNDFSGIAALERKLRESETIEDLIVNGRINDVRLLLSFDLTEDPDEPEEKIVSIDRTEFMISRSDLLSNESDVKAQEIKEAYLKFVSSAFKLLHPEMEDTNATAKRILDLEIELAKIATKKEDRRDWKERLKKFSKNELFDLAPGINLTRVINGILGNRTVDTVIVEDIPYFKNLSRVLKGKEDVVKDLMTRKLINAYGRAVSTKFEDLKFEFNKVKQGLKTQGSLKESIFWTLIDELPNVLGRLYIDTVGFDEKDQKRVDSMIHKVKEAMRRMIDEKDWMDNATKATAKKKLDLMRANVGYPKWIKNDSELIESFSLEPDESEGNFEMLLRLNKYHWNKNMEEFDEPIDPEHDWVLSPAVTNAYHLPVQNYIVFLAAFLSGVYYNSTCPDSLNYGTVGSVIGHEVTHAFDDGGSQFDPTGRLVNWWSNETLKNFKKAAKKMIDQYGSILDERTNLTLNGINTQGENIADNGGLRAAYKAYFDERSNETKLTGFEYWTPEKLFFLSYANSYCEVTNDQSLRSSILNHAHAPNNYRVNVPLSNFEAFAQAFQCKEGSKMNPKNKVRVW